MTLAVKEICKTTRRQLLFAYAERLHNKNYAYLRPIIGDWLSYSRRLIIEALGESKFFAKQLSPSDITTKLVDWKTIQADGKRRLKPSMLVVLSRSANEAKVIGSAAPDFDMLNPKAIKWADE